MREAGTSAAASVHGTLGLVVPLPQARQPVQLVTTRVARRRCRPAADRRRVSPAHRRIRRRRKIIASYVGADGDMLAVFGWCVFEGVMPGMMLPVRSRSQAERRTRT